MRRLTLLLIAFLFVFFISSALLFLSPRPDAWSSALIRGAATLWEQTLSGELLRSFLPHGKGDPGEGGLFDDERLGSSPPFPAEERGGSWEFRIALSPSEVHPEVREKAEAVTQNSATPREAGERIYRWITENIAYDVQKYKAGNPYVPNAHKTLKTRKGICGDYAMLAHEMFISAGLESVIKTGEVVTDVGREKHAWNEVKIDDTLFALDTTWGAGHLSAGGLSFVHHPNPLFFTSPEELQKLHTDLDYRKSRYQQWMKKEALAAAPAYLFAHEESLFRFLNRSREANNRDVYTFCNDLHKEARRLAEKVAEKECREESWSLELNNSRARLHSSAALAAKVYFYWGFPPLAPEEIYQGWMEDAGNRQLIISSEYNHAGIGVVKRGDLVVVIKLLAHYPR